MSTLIFAGGGSGGHIYPGLAIAEQARELSRSRGVQPPKCVFVCSDRPLDARILSEAGEPFVSSPAKPVGLRPRALARFLASWGKSVRHMRGLIRDARVEGPVHLVAMGGFVAAPAVQAARAERLGAASISMVNLDAVPGKANRWIAPRVGAVFSAASVPSEYKPATRASWVDVPPIVRTSAIARVAQPEARRALGLAPVRPVLMVTGGSQGLRSVNDFVAAFAKSPAGREALAAGAWQIIHQTGRGFEQAVRAAYSDAGIDAIVVEFTQQMGLWWSAADVCVCTAGAGNVAEVWSSKTPALLLPYPHHRDQHQKFNAAVLKQAGGVVVGVDLVEPGANLRENGPALTRLLTDAPSRQAMRDALIALGEPDGARRVAASLLDALARA